MTTPKHKRVLRDGQTSRGPARWLRAADNAMRQPDSKGAKLFWSRAAIAQEFRTTYGHNWTGPFEHRGWTHVENPDWPGRFGVAPRFVRQEERKYVTCSAFCMAMVVQLDAGGINQARDLIGYLFQDVSENTWHWVRKLDADNPRRLKRSVRCQFCGSDVQPL